jgi:quinoprotein glucose dehydrogenase
MMTTYHSKSIATNLYGAVLFLIACTIIGGGGWLLLLKGSPYYLVLGIALLACAILTWRRRRTSIYLYGALLIVTIIWSLWEVGFTPWALMPRLVFLFVVGAWMLTPSFRRSMAPAPATVSRYTSGGAFIVGLVGAVLVGGIMHQFNPPAPDPRFQAGTGPFPELRRTTVAGMPAGDWRHWGNEQGGARFSPLQQITPANVDQLQLAWTAPLAHSKRGESSGLEVTPLMIGDTLFACNGANEIYAIDAETGAERWHVETAGNRGRNCRGVAYYRVPDATGVCAERILTATGSAALVALDARTGQRCAGFGQNGNVDLLDGLSQAPRQYYYVTSAPAIVRGNVVVGGWVSDGQYWGEPSGVVRAFDAVTGKLAWAWDMGRPERTGAPAPGETYTPATPNSWAPISADEQLGLVYLPTGNATPDYFGAQRRSFDDRYSSSIVALDAGTGRVRWSFQTVHHDLWDYDVASQPTLTDLPLPNGGTVPALLQLTKRGEVFLLDRTNGKPLHPVVERPVPQAGKAPEERLSPTQPFSTGLPSFRNPDVRETDMWGITPIDQLMCRITFKGARSEGTMTPPGPTPSISSPGYLGGMDWGGASIDVDRGVMIVNSAKLANHVQLVPRKEADKMGLKPITDEAKTADVGGLVAQAGTPYAAHPMPFLSALGVPCQAPPYGYLSAVDLVTGKLIWTRWLGDARDSGPLGLRAMLPLPLGTPTTGGSMTTRSGLVFIGATMDRGFRAFDEKTGKQLWRASLPAGAFATPMTYLSPRSGRQFIVVAAGGSHGLGQTDGARLMAYVLPANAH